MREVSPTGSITEFVEVFREAGPKRWRTALAAAATTGLLFWMLTHDTWRGPPPRPTVTYINSWPLTRTDKQRHAFIKANQKFIDERAAEQAQAEEELRQMYKAAGRASGMDVERIEREAKADAKPGVKPGVAPKAKPPAAVPQAAVAQN